MLVIEPMELIVGWARTNVVNADPAGSLPDGWPEAPVAAPLDVAI